MNITTDPLTGQDSLAVDEEVNHASAVFGFIVFLLNFLVLVYLLRLVVQAIQKGDNTSLLVHLISVCINDTITGFSIFLVSVMYVENTFSIHVCAYSIFCTLALQNASQGNIVCISLQRYICARNIRKHRIAHQRFYTKTLLTVNSLVAIASLCYCILLLTIRENVLFDNACNYSNVANGNSLLVVSVFFAIGIPFTVVSDILCLMAVNKLRTKVTCELETTTSSYPTETPTNTEHVRLRTNNTLWQQKAMVTIILILVSFNVSFLPSLIGFIIKLADVALVGNASRLMYTSLSLNSLLNPFIIAWRTHSMRSLIKHDVATLVTTCCSKLTTPST